MRVNLIWQHLRARKLVQWALAYLAGGWVLLQVAGLLRSELGWSPLVFRITLALVITGFAAALVLAWYHGEKGAQRLSRLELGILTGVLLVGAAAVAFVSRDGSTVEAVPVAGDVVAAVAEQGSIAVLPFINMSGDPAQEFFSDGITEELLHALAQVPGLRVAARTSSFQFKGEKADVREVGRRLGVATVLEGSVRKAGDHLRITAQLIGVEGGYHLWSQSYDRELKDLFAIQEEISRSIVEALKLRLGAGAAAPLIRAGTGDLETYSLYLRGRYHYHRYTPTDLRESVRYYEQALARDPNYARAHAGLADTWMESAAVFGHTHMEAEQKAKAAALRALALDSTLAEARAALGEVLCNLDWDLEASERELRRALRDGPNDANVYHHLARTLFAAGRSDEAIAISRQALSLDPLSGVIGSRLVFYLSWSRGYDDAITEGKRLLEVNPMHPRIVNALAGAYLNAGRAVEALALLDESGHGDTVLRGRALAQIGRHAEARAIAAQVERDATLLVGDGGGLGLLYVELGDYDRAFDALYRALAARASAIVFLRVRPEWDPIRSDPRFPELLKRAGV